MPLAVRLAGVFGLLIAAALLVVVALTLVLTRSHLERTLDTELRASAQSFRNGPAAGARSTAELRARAREWLSESPLPKGQMAAVRLAGGGVLTSTGGVDLFEVATPRELLTSTRSRWWRLDGSDGPVRGLTVPILRGRHQLGTLVLLAYEEPVDRTLAALLSRVGLAAAAGLALALLLGILAVRRSLRPLTSMAAEVAAVEATGDLSRRVATGGERDEVARLARAFDRMLARLEEAFDTQRRFVADASHELRTPLTVVRGQLEVLSDELGTAGAGDSIAVATAELDRMTRIVDDLLLLARLDEGMELQREPVEVELVLREAQLRTRLCAPTDVRVAADPDVYALADGERLLQVVTNLVGNAVRHTDETGTVVLLSRRRNGGVEIEVADDGPGIPPAELPRVFERFYRGAEERSAPDGSGLGLAIARSLVAAMDGSIEVRSARGEGTAFTVTLPAAQ